MLNNDIIGRKPETKVIIRKDTHANAKWKFDQAIEGIVKSKGKRSKCTELSCASTDASGKSVRFIMDTGCGHDLMSQRKVKELGSKPTLTMMV